MALGTGIATINFPESAQTAQYSTKDIVTDTVTYSGGYANPNTMYDTTQFESSNYGKSLYSSDNGVDINIEFYPKILRISNNTIQSYFITPSHTTDSGTSNICFFKDRWIFSIPNTTKSYYSFDGDSWILSTIRNTAVSTMFASSYNIILGVQSGSATADYSADGITWLTLALPAALSWTYLCYLSDSSKFFITDGTNTGMYTSPGGGTWTNLATTGGTGTQVIGGVNGYLVVVMGDFIYYSLTGSSWTSSATVSTSGALAYITTFNNICMVYFAGISTYYTSTNGTTWTARTTPTLSNITADSLGRKSSGFILFDSVSNRQMLSSDGVNWTADTLVPIVTNALFGNRNSICNNRWAYFLEQTISPFNKYVATSTDGSTFSLSSTLPSPSVGSYNQQIYYYGGTYLVVGDTVAESAYSTNLTSWSTGTIPFAGISPINHFMNNANTFLIINSALTQIAYSTNATSWTTTANPVTSGQYISTIPGKIIIYSSTNVSVSSTDGVSWSASTALPITVSSSISGTNNAFYFADNVNGFIYRSTSGLTWDRCSVSFPITQLENFYFYTYNNLEYAFGDFGTVLSSSDGFNWSERQEVSTIHTLTSSVNNNISLTLGTVSKSYSPITIASVSRNTTVESTEIEPAKPKVGTNSSSVVVTGLVDIASTSYIEAFMMGSDTTATHNGVEHEIVDLNLSVDTIVPGTGFTITAESDKRLIGDFKVRYVWKT